MMFLGAKTRAGRERKSQRVRKYHEIVNAQQAWAKIQHNP